MRGLIYLRNHNNVNEYSVHIKRSFPLFFAIITRDIILSLLFLFRYLQKIYTNAFKNANRCIRYLYARVCYI